MHGPKLAANNLRPSLASLDLLDGHWQQRLGMALSTQDDEFNRDLQEEAATGKRVNSTTKTTYPSKRPLSLRRSIW